MEASQEGHLELVRYLLEARADVNATTGTKYRAIERKKTEYVQHSACNGAAMDRLYLSPTPVFARGDYYLPSRRLKRWEGRDSTL
jgi:hypothetical protein